MLPVSPLLDKRGCIPIQINDVQNFDLRGQPLDDRRLTLSGTTVRNMINQYQQYRMWRDGQQILVPVGQSISLPYSSENVGANIATFGFINQGYFQPPIFEARNTTDFALFDRFTFGIMRPFPPDTEDINIFGLNVIEIDFTLIVEYNGSMWNIPQRVRFYNKDGEYFFSDRHYITTDNQYADMAHQSVPYTVQFQAEYLIDMTSRYSQRVGDVTVNNEMYIDISQISVINGSSEYYLNNIYNPDIPEMIIIETTDITLIRGWS